MATRSASIAQDELTETIRHFLASPPDGTPAVILEQLKAALERARGELPGHLFFAAVEQAQVAISITDLNANILYANPYFTKVTGYTVEEVAGSNESLLSDKSTPKAVYEELWQQLVNKQPWFGKLINRRKDGTRYLAELIVAPVLDGDGAISHYLGMHRDITDMHRIQRELVNQKRLVESTINAAPVMMALLDESGRVVLDNLAYKTLATDMGSEPADKLLAAVKKQLGRDQLGEFKSIEVSYQAPRSLKTRWFSCSASWFAEQDSSANSFFAETSRDYLLLVATEITESRQQQEQMRSNAMRVLLAEEEREQALREAISAAIFKLQGPFNMLNAAYAMMERKSGECEHDSAMTSLLQQVIGAGKETIDDLERVLPKERNDSVTSININSLLKDVMTLSTPRLLKAGITVNWEPAEVLPAVTGYENQIRSMFKQVMDNAMDAMDSNRVRNREITIRTLADSEDNVHIVFCDTGPGVPDDLRIKVFEPFYTSRGEKGHAGMGLALVQDVMNQHAGTVSLDSSQTGGCRVTMVLPVTFFGN